MNMSVALVRSDRRVRFRLNSPVRAERSSPCGRIVVDPTSLSGMGIGPAVHRDVYETIWHSEAESVNVMAGEMTCIGRSRSVG